MAKVYMDSFTNQIVTPEEAEKRLFHDAQEFEWENAIASFSWLEIQEGLKPEFYAQVEQRYETIYFPQRFTEYEIYGDENPEDENGEGDNRIWPPEDENGEVIPEDPGDSTEPEPTDPEGSE